MTRFRVGLCAAPESCWRNDTGGGLDGCVEIKKASEVPMGRVCMLRAVWDDTIEQLLEWPSRLNRLLSQGDECDHEAGADEGDGPIDDRGASTDLDKAWHAIHFCLAGTDWDGPQPWAFLLTGGQTIGDEEGGCGEVRAFSSDEVAAIADALDSISLGEFSKRLRLDELTRRDIYPEIWEDAENKDYVMEHFSNLRNFLSELRNLRRGVLIYYG